MDKAELLQLNHTQFPSLGIFVSKRLEIEKIKTTFIMIFKSCIQGGLNFFKFQLFLLTKVLREEILFAANSALVCFQLSLWANRADLGRSENFFNFAKVSYFCECFFIFSWTKKVVIM